MTTCLTLCSLLLLVPSARAQQSRFRVDGDRIKSYIEHLSTDQMLGRQTLTEGYRMAAEWVASKFEEWGLEPAGENGTYFQRVPIGRDLTFYTGVPTLSVNGLPFSQYEGDFSIGTTSTAGTTIDAGIVFVGYGISAPDKGLDEYAGINVRGRIVVALKGSPKDAPAPRIRMGGAAPVVESQEEEEEEWTEESTDRVKIETAYNKGAAAILLFDPDEEAQAAARFTRGRGEPAGITPTRDFLSFTINTRVSRAILMQDPQESTGGFSRRLGTIRFAIRNKNTRSFDTGMRGHLTGYETATQYSEELGNNVGRNVIAKLPGRGRLSNQYVIMGGHLDHLGVRNGLVYNGADDNASGPAVAMEVARVLKEGGFRPRRTIIFCAWCGEEMGLIGSNYYADNPCDGVTMDNVVTYFNMDMVGMGNTVGAPGGLNFPSIWEVITRDQDEDVMAAIQPSTGGPGGSDHSAFITRGIEAMALMTRGGGGHPDYHQPEDDTEKIEPEILRKTGQFVIQGTMNLASETRVNLLIENRLNIYNATMLRITSFNPDLAEGTFRYVDIDARSKDDLVRVVLDSASALVQRQREQTTAQQQMMARFGRGVSIGGGRRSFARGVSDLRLFEGDTALLASASEFIGFGRIDVKSDDGIWFSGGRLTRRGRRALQAMEENNLTVHLASPSQNLINDMIAAAARPFIITGTYSISEAMVDSINGKNILLGVIFNPTDVNGCIAALDRTKALLGDTDNLFLCVTSEEGLEEAQKALYLGLIDKGWTHLEIAGDRRSGGGITGGNLTRLTRGE